ncbi:hypothetical protein AT959_18825 [Dechloromonas denitrificans]|uniref:Glycosyl transferase family 1 domain-containing protein n=1 Tax=Dechloromonas denitrificans TaxID=281362 RepID=A0A133XE83_9RHOO|nr:glycosyltransferase [Dechloromonas denitrificans]KXB29238.1 hypothetical protein AT959_18825 [Dechloromonas denitrificans]
MSGATRNILLIHPNFPGQFRHLARQWAGRPDLRVVVLGNTDSPGIPGLRHLRYRSPDAKPGGHPYLRPMEQAVRVGQAAARVYRRVLQVSATHVYLSYPFVLSWSMLEAMASGCLVIGADTAPVREELRHGENGWRVDFFDDAVIAGRIVEVLNDPAAQEALRRQAREDMVAGYSLRQGLAGYERLLGIAAPEPASPRIIPNTLSQQKPPSQNQTRPLIGGLPLWRQIA